MRYPASEKLEIIRIVEQSQLHARRTLEQLAIPETRAKRGLRGRFHVRIPALEAFS